MSFDPNKILVTKEDRLKFIVDICQLLEDKGFENNIVMALENEAGEVMEYKAEKGPIYGNVYLARAYLVDHDAKVNAFRVKQRLQEDENN